MEHNTNSWRSQDRNFSSTFGIDEPLGLTLGWYLARQGRAWREGDPIGKTIPAKTLWTSFIAECKSSNSEFVTGLTKAQQNTARILVEWWNREIDDTEFASAIIARIEKCLESDEWDSFLSRKDHKLTDWDYQSMLQYLFAYEFLAVDQSYKTAHSETSDGHHHKRIVNEFAKLSHAVAQNVEHSRALLDGKKHNIITISKVRNRAAMAAARQRLTFFTISSILDTEPIVQESSSDQISEVSSKFAQLHSDDSQELDRRPGAFINPCPWLHQNVNADLPRFLWDIEEMKTIDFKDEPERPPYTIISHTWGRWMVQHLDPSDPNPSINIKGVDWKVSRNTKFDIQALPEVFRAHRSLFSPTKHIWFDLFCIPQDESVASWATLKAQEIARQAAIFDSAHQAICWLNDIDDWRPLQAVIKWLCLFFTVIMEHEFVERETRHTAASRSHKAMRDPKLHEMLRADGPNFKTGLLKKVERPADREVTIHDTKFTSDPDGLIFIEAACGWFTSLWTLQEITLRPDMILCNRRWEPLRLDNVAEGPIVPMDHIIALLAFHGVQGMFAHAAGFPGPVRELLQTFQISGLLYSPIGMHPLGLLSTADSRECMTRRAEAIMSAVGATKWYHEIPRERHEDDLVLQTYPIQFLREVRSIVGNSFFSSQYSVSCEFWDVYEDIWERTRRLRDDQVGPVTAHTSLGGAHVVGTMLPFNRVRSASRNFKTGMPYSPSADGNLLSNKTWELSNDGRVKMGEVSLLASTDRELYPVETVTAQRIWRVLGPDTDNPRRIIELKSTCLHEYLQEQLVPWLPGRARHAVLTINTPDIYCVTGAILMQVYDDEKPVRTFAKVADFVLDNEVTQGPEGASLVQSQVVAKAVGWEVL